MGTSYHNIVDKKLPRPICTTCHKPTPQTCICSSLPSRPIHLLKCRILILQHPHEARHKNRSVPLVELCLAKLSNHKNSDDDYMMRTLVGRRLGDLMNTQNGPIWNNMRGGDVMLVYPSEEAVSFKEGLAKIGRRRLERDMKNHADEKWKVDHKITLLFIDATWKYANEMERACTTHKEWPDSIICVRLRHEDMMSTQGSRDEESHDKAECHKHGLDNCMVRERDLDGDSKTRQNEENIRPTTTTTSQLKDGIQKDTIMVDTSIDNKTEESITQFYIHTRFKAQRFDIRTPPDDEKLSTAECIAWVVSLIEEDSYIYNALMKPLDLMVEQWHSFSDHRGCGNDRHLKKKRKRRRGITCGDVHMEGERNNGEGEHKILKKLSRGAAL